MKYRFNIILFLIILVWLSFPAFLGAQISQGGLPYSVSMSLLPDTGTYVLTERPALDILLREDDHAALPYRFAVNLPVDLGIEKSGQWHRTSGGLNIWRLNIKSTGAQALILYFDRFNIPEGGRVFVYNPKRTQILGAFTSLNNNDLSTFATGLMFGDELTLEYNAPDGAPLPEIHISEIGHAYRGITHYPRLTDDFGGSGPCMVNVNCAEGANWQKEKRSLTRIAVKRGSESVWCTGSLVNNVRNDGKPYILTADHCGYKSSALDLSQWIFDFNYEGSGCPDPTTEPALKSMTGATLVAHGGNAASTGSDFFLVLLKSNVPDSYNAYYNGWSRETIPPSTSGVGIHHPFGDIKKISTYTTPLQPAHWSGNPALAHWRVTWNGTANGHGTTEGGSSGSPIFDNQGRLVGTLTGGESACDSGSLNLPDYYGMFSYHWNQNGSDSSSVLKYWLDPDNTDVMTLNGWALSVADHVADQWVRVFPNPVADQLKIIFSADDGKDTRVKGYDIWGNLRLQKNLTNALNHEISIDMSGFAAGVYFFEISNGERQVVRKVIKQ